MRLARRHFLKLATAATLSTAPRIGRAQAYPTRSITIIVPFAPGGGTDVSARVVGEHMSRTLGQQFVIENFPGAGGTTGSIRAMRATADGYTIEMGHIGTHAVSVWLYPQLAYKPDVDFDPRFEIMPGTKAAGVLASKEDPYEADERQPIAE